MDGKITIYKVRMKNYQEFYIKENLYNKPMMITKVHEIDVGVFKGLEYIWRIYDCLYINMFHIESIEPVSIYKNKDYLKSYFKDILKKIDYEIKKSTFYNSQSEKFKFTIPEEAFRYSNYPIFFSDYVNTNNEVAFRVIYRTDYMDYGIQIINAKNIGLEFDDLLNGEKLYCLTENENAN
ncbi:hypothetical protein [Lactobacillus mulieris]|uniref:hypothetical protein n=1 Tax=Lactobacillus mulieris TaxID=2508708 RepID=UPI002244D034|nr:hypothetical protein [Lactobacillus mulieris]MCW8123424.1 hypothetical protein [Lactobacillus mulieris]MDK7326587.1 hypothetical protein [Lactobacillus mulieris]